MSLASVEIVAGKTYAIVTVALDGTRLRVWEGASYMEALVEANDHATALGCAVRRVAA